MPHPTPKNLSLTMELFCGTTDLVLSLALASSCPSLKERREKVNDFYAFLAPNRDYLKRGECSEGPSVTRANLVLVSAWPRERTIRCVHPLLVPKFQSAPIAKKRC